VFQVELEGGKDIVASEVVHSAKRDGRFAEVGHRSSLASRHLDFDSSEVDITTCEVGATTAAEVQKTEIVLPAEVFLSSILCSFLIYSFVCFCMSLILGWL
jgi:hypothetical protein